MATSTGTAAVLLLAFSCVPGCAGQEPGTAMEKPPSHHTGRGYRNITPHDEHGFPAFLRWRFGGGPKDPTVSPPGGFPEFLPPVAVPDRKSIDHPPSDAIQVTWIGHATFLVQAGGQNILTDPLFSDRASPVSFAGPKRLAPPGIPLRDLPQIDAVVISHNHYDHLDDKTIRALGGRPRYFVPLGFATWFAERGITNVQELDWWGTAALGGIVFHAVPAQHFSSRTPFDRNEALWAGWVIETPQGKVYHSGCTGYAPLFREIGKRLGPMRLSFIPIGGYSPRWFMRSMHVDPPEAVRIHQDVRSEQSIGMHWATFKLTDEHMLEPPFYLNRSLREAGIEQDRFIVMQIGETRAFR